MVYRYDDVAVVRRAFYACHPKQRLFLKVEAVFQYVLADGMDFLFGILGSPIPQDIPGTNPQDMHSSPLLEKVDVDLTALR